MNICHTGTHVLFSPQIFFNLGGIFICIQETKIWGKYALQESWLWNRIGKYKLALPKGEVLVWPFVPAGQSLYTPIVQATVGHPHHSMRGSWQVGDIAE